MKYSLNSDLHFQDNFEELVGHDQLLVVLKSLGQPSLSLIEAVFDWVRKHFIATLFVKFIEI